jgi:hypothetical protein
MPKLVGVFGTDPTIVLASQLSLFVRGAGDGRLFVWKLCLLAWGDSSGLRPAGLRLEVRRGLMVRSVLGVNEYPGWS